MSRMLQFLQRIIFSSDVQNMAIISDMCDLFYHYILDMFFFLFVFGRTRVWSVCFHRVGVGCDCKEHVEFSTGPRFQTEHSKKMSLL